MSYPSYSDLELEIQNLEQENRALKEKIELLEIFLDDRETSIELLKEENKKLKEKVKDAYQKWLEQWYKDQ